MSKRWYVRVADVSGSGPQRDFFSLTYSLSNDNQKFLYVWFLWRAGITIAPASHNCTGAIAIAIVTRLLLKIAMRKRLIATALLDLPSEVENVDETLLGRSSAIHCCWWEMTSLTANGLQFSIIYSKHLLDIYTQTLLLHFLLSQL